MHRALASLALLVSSTFLVSAWAQPNHSPNSPPAPFFENVTIWAPPASWSSHSGSYGRSVLLNKDGEQGIPTMLATAAYSPPNGPYFQIFESQFRDVYPRTFYLPSGQSAALRLVAPLLFWNKLVIVQVLLTELSAGRFRRLASRKCRRRPCRPRLLAFQREQRKAIASSIEREGRRTHETHAPPINWSCGSWWHTYESRGKMEIASAKG
ncbi:hypothetical protein B0H16DRAFT_1474745 [Mycena metata]|uniref:Uncharacterized protein n=1 Tax=Mycena metata TaxID=1033252 RepID=A0AAD7HFN4_9AGAR|nr:hypothetical protein B0H16DRAFT_1474745 [Mycena metata]